VLDSNRYHHPGQAPVANPPYNATSQRELQNLTETSGASGHQKLRVCDVCGAYLSVLDSDRRLADHFGGKVSSPYIPFRPFGYKTMSDLKFLLDASWILRTPQNARRTERKTPRPTPNGTSPCSSLLCPSALRPSSTTTLRT